MTTTPPALEWSIDNCTVQRALQVLGDRWSFVVLREVFNGVRRFADMRVRTAVPRQVLTDRLAHLVAEGLLRREPYQEAGQRAREEYRLTTKGMDLYPVLVSLNHWGTTYYADPEGSPLEFRHRGCGAGIAVRLECADGHRVDDLTQVQPHPARARTGEGTRRVARIADDPKVIFTRTPGGTSGMPGSTRRP